MNRDSDAMELLRSGIVRIVEACFSDDKPGWFAESSYSRFNEATCETEFFSATADDPADAIIHAAEGWPG